MTRTRRVAVGAIGFLALAGCSGSKESDTSPPTTTEAPPPPTEAPEVEERLSDGKQFAQALSERMDLLEEGTQAFADVGEALEAFDLVEASAAARQGARTFGQLHDYAQGLPGADSVVGRASISAFATCRDALEVAGSSLSSYDVQEMEVATALLTGCVTAIDRATTAVTAEL